MNFLAHIYLSGTSDELLVGNFIGDFVKGRKFNDYPEKIKEGILLHRHIDNFTDTHSVVRKSKSYFQHSYGKYSGVIIDILYDYFLSKNWHYYSSVSLDVFIGRLFMRLSKYISVFPQSVKNFFPNFVNHNWLASYGTLAGIEGVFNGMSKKTSLPNETESAMQIIASKYEQLNKEFNLYFPELMDYVTSAHDVEFEKSTGSDFMPAIIPPFAS